QSIMLLLRAEELDSCLQIAWAEYHRAVGEFIRPPKATSSPAVGLAPILNGLRGPRSAVLARVVVKDSVAEGQGWLGSFRCAEVGHRLLPGVSPFCGFGGGGEDLVDRRRVVAAQRPVALAA